MTPHEAVAKALSSHLSLPGDAMPNDEWACCATKAIDALRECAEERVTKFLLSPEADWDNIGDCTPQIVNAVLGKK